VQALSAVTTFLFTDIEGSTHLWEQEPERMGPALARHDAGPRIAAVRPSGNTPSMELCAPAKCRSVTYVSGMKCYPSLRKGISALCANLAAASGH
jgi:hypothetical protein